MILQESTMDNDAAMVIAEALYQLLLELHPTWTPEQLAAELRNRIYSAALEHISPIDGIGRIHWKILSVYFFLLSAV